MNFIKDGRYPITLQGIYYENPQTSFPAGFDPRELGYEPVASVAKPEYNTDTEALRELPPLHDGTRWLEVWEVVALDAEAVAAITAQKEAASKASIWSQIDIIERDKLMPRALRTLILADLNHPAYVKVKEIDDQIEALKAQL